MARRGKAAVAQEVNLGVGPTGGKLPVTRQVGGSGHPQGTLHGWLRSLGTVDSGPLVGLRLQRSAACKRAEKNPANREELTDIARKNYAVREQETSHRYPLAHHERKPSLEGTRGYPEAR